MKLSLEDIRFWLRSIWLKKIVRPAYIPSSPVFFIHIPKTAGTSFRDMLYQQFDQNIIYPNLMDLRRNKGAYIPFHKARNEIPTLDRNLLLLCGHYPMVLEKSLPIPFQFFVFLREPIARTISNLQHFQRNKKNCHHLSLMEIFDKYLAHFQNLQTRFLCDTSLESPLVFTHTKTLSEKSLIQAKMNLEKCTFIGITEKFDKSITIAEHLLNLKLGKPLKKNTNPEKNNNIDPSIKSHIEPFLNLDIKLYKYGLKLFENQRANISQS